MLVEGVCCIEIVLVLFLPSLETCKDSSICARVLSLCCCPLASSQVREFILLFSSTGYEPKAPEAIAISSSSHFARQHGRQGSRGSQGERRGRRASGFR